VKKQTLFVALGLAVTVTVGLPGCAKTVDQRGYLMDEELIQEIRPGVDNRASVLAALGTPTVPGTFDDENWYYVSRTHESWAFFRPDTVDNQVLQVSFDPSGNVKEITRAGMEAARDVNPVDAKTPTRGKELGFFEQIFSNIGRFSGPGPAAPGN
jgi:outer membrane protein assembly factor BamE (lipoprotein component of BamABCDE complex)